MHYLKEAVVSPVQTAKLDERFSDFPLPWKLPEEDKEVIKEIVGDVNGKVETRFYRIVARATDIMEGIEYDEGKQHPGLRSASETLRARQGNCFETAALMAGILDAYGIDVSWLFLKNPVGYERDNWTHETIHPLLLWHPRKNQATYLCIDAAVGEVQLNRVPPNLGETFATQRETLALFFQYHAEQLAWDWFMPVKAIQYLQVARMTDPNNYTILGMEGDIRMYLGHTRKADEAYEKACSITPDLLDPYAEWGNARLKGGNRLGAIEKYTEALKHPTRDLQLLHVLERTLRRLGRMKLASKAEDLSFSLRDEEWALRYIDVA